MSALWTTVRRFLGTTKQRFLVFLLVDAVFLYWLLFRATLVCVKRLTGPPRTDCYAIVSDAGAVNPVGVAVFAAVASIILYVVFQVVVALAGRLGADEGDA